MNSSNYILYFTLTLLLFFFSSNELLSQSIKINGQAYDKESKLPLPRLMIINKRTNNGIFADAEGKFSIKIEKSDTLILSAIGFKVKKISFKDSIVKEQYDLFIPLEKLYFALKEITVFAPRSLNEIQKDIDKLGVRRTYTAEGLDAISSPITYLYERFSKFGQSKRKVAELENEDMKRDVLKDLFRLYIKHEIIDLNEEEFDAFIKYLNLSDEFIKNASQLELVLAVKGKYENFKYRWK